MEVTNFKEAYETLLREYSTIRQQLDQWQAGGDTMDMGRCTLVRFR
jgi:hypothetical protein